MKNKKLSLENDIISNLIHQNKVSGEFLIKNLDIGSKKTFLFKKKCKINKEQMSIFR